MDALLFRVTVFLCLDKSSKGVYFLGDSDYVLAISGLCQND